MENITDSSNKTEWCIFIKAITRPLVMIPSVLTIIALYVANQDGIDKRLSIFLQVVATVALAIAGACFYDLFKKTFSGDILVKKGQSAVRNLALARLKTKNITDRSKLNATKEETENLLTLLEKDIANATQEWNDILPGIGKIEEVYNLLAEKEEDLRIANNEKEKLNKGLSEERQLGVNEKEVLKKKHDEQEKRINELTEEINKLRITRDSVPFSGTANLGGLRSAFQSLGAFKTCSICGKIYTKILGDVLAGTSGGKGICENCRKEIIIRQEIINRVKQNDKNQIK